MPRRETTAAANVLRYSSRRSFSTRSAQDPPRDAESQHGKVSDVDLHVEGILLGGLEHGDAGARPRLHRLHVENLRPLNGRAGPSGRER